MAWLNVDIDRLLEAMTAPDLRTATVLAFQNMLLANTHHYRARLEAARARILLLISYGFPKILMEKMLNDEFDPSDRRIYILNTPGYVRPCAAFVPGDAYENNSAAVYEPPQLPTATLYEGARRTSGQDFIVVIPVDPMLIVHLPRMAALVCRYKYADKDFTIRYMVLGNLGPELYRFQGTPATE